MPNDIKKLRRLMRTANYIRAEHPANGNMSFALSTAWWFESFRAKLRSGIYRFSYFKKDGGIREAVGTLDPSLIPEENMPKSGIDPEAVAKQETFCYYDLSVNGWRSFCIDLFIGFVTEV